jgi:hypothetical protein
MRRLVAPRTWIVLSLLAVCLSCGSDSNDPGNGGSEVAEVTIDVAADSLIELATRQILYSLKDANGTVLPGQPLSWSSSNPNVATVNGSGLLTAHSAGATVITGSLGSLSDQTSIKVLVPIASVTISPDTISLLPGEQQIFQAVTRDQIGNLVTGRVVTWSSIPAGRVTIAGNTVTARSPGAVQIQASTIIQAVQGMAAVSVLDSVATITVTLTPDSLLPTGTTQATAVARKASGAILPTQPVVWSTADSAIATVTSTGMVTAHGPGNVAISASLRSKTGSGTARVLYPTASLTVLPNPVLMAVPGTLAFVATPRNVLGNPLSTRFLTWSTAGTAGISLSPLNNHVMNAVASTPGISTVSATTVLDSVSASAAIEIGRTITLGSLGAGLAQTCGIGTDLLTWCWGQSAFDLVTTNVPTTAQGWPAFTSVVAGSNFRCGLTGAAAAFCWGGNEFGELGNGTGSLSTASAPVPVSGALTWVQLSAGANTVCGISTGGPTYCWGYGSRGQLGNNTSGLSRVPVQVMAPAGVAFVSVSTGPSHTCGLTSAGKAYCWGWNDAGKLGIDSIETVNGEAGSRLTPVPVNTSLLFKNISAGGSHTCAVATDDTGWCWGYGGTGALGTNSTASFLHAVAVSGGLAFQRISASREFTCATTTDGEAWCWGLNTDNQVGPNGGGGTLVPVSVGLNVTELVTGLKHACAVAGGTVYCWGTNGATLGQGNGGNPSGSAIPLKVLGQP